MTPDPVTSEQVLEERIERLGNVTIHHMPHRKPASKKWMIALLNRGQIFSGPSLQDTVTAALEQMVEPAPPGENDG